MERTRLRLVVACFFKHIVSITVVALLVTGSVDCFISCKIMKPIVFVSESFLPEVFSATLSFSTLSLTVLSLIIGLMDTRMTGLKLREILSLNSSPVKFMFLICYCATLSFLSIFFYAMNWHTTITVIATLILMYTTYASITVFNLVSDSQYCSGIIMDEYGIEGIRFLSRYIFSWMDEYQSALRSRNYSELEIYSKILKTFFEQSDSKRILLGKGETPQEIILGRLPDILDAACQSLLFKDAVYWAFSRIGVSFYLTKHICQEYISRISFFNDMELLSYNIPQHINSLMEAGDVECNQIFSYAFISALIENTSAGVTRQKMLNLRSNWKF